MAFTVHRNPHHVHIEASCLDHSTCPTTHWKGGRPESTHPHYVEIDASTGLIGYTRLTAQEIATAAKSAQATELEYERSQRARESDLKRLRTRARTDEDFAALLRHLNLN